jgi:RNA polymerase sigma factor (sigma-70 family)
MSDDPPVTGLLAHAASGDKQAWDALVERYAPLVWLICRRHRLSDAEARDISHNIWLQLASRLGEFRDPAALAGWLASTTGRECGKVPPGAQATGYQSDAGHITDQQTQMASRELPAAGQHAALRDAFTRLPPCCQRLLVLLLEDPLAPYPQIGAKLGIPAGSIEPSRSRCLDKLRRDPAITALISAVP